MSIRLNLITRVLIFGLCCLGAATVAEAQKTTPPPDWKDDWALAPGFAVDADTAGYQFPSDIEFIPNPGPGPKDPLYFVLELKGTLKVVANDRSVHTFATDILPIPLKESFQQIGTAGMCLEPENGYVFVSFGYLDKTQVFRNGMVRFTTTPGTFGLAATGREMFLDLFANERSDTAHQIGPCAIQDGQLFVPVGYGKDRSQSQNLQSTQGSILRMDFNFQPFPDNPFFTEDGATTAIDYAWSYGHRNVFGLKVIKDRLFATENGGSIDRFLEIEGGENYLWRGDDWSIASRAGFVFGPSVGLVQLDYLPADNPIFPENYRDMFFIALAGAPGAKGADSKGARSVVSLRFDTVNNRAAEPPNQLIAYRGEGFQLPVSVAFGPDGLYFVALLPQADGSVPVMKITYDPDRGHPHVLGQDIKPAVLINQYSCRQCHRIAGTGGRYGPGLGRARFDEIRERIYTPEYSAQVAQIDAIDNEPFNTYRSQRQQILSAEGEEKLERWLSTYLLEPVFDNPEVQMPNPGMTEQHAQIIAKYLIEITSPKTAAEQQPSALDLLRFTIARAIPELRYRHLIGAFVVGGGLGTMIVGLLAFFLRRRMA